MRLSIFAQFEREVTGERIRDKIAASKKKGLWMGVVGGADKKWKGNFWFCFAASVSKKSNLIMTFLFALFYIFAATRGAHVSGFCSNSNPL